MNYTLIELCSNNYNEYTLGVLFVWAPAISFVGLKSERPNDPGVLLAVHGRVAERVSTAVPPPTPRGHGVIRGSARKKAGPERAQAQTGP